MSNEINLTTSDGKKIYFPNSDAQVEKSWANESFWGSVFSAINKDGNNKLSTDEINDFLGQLKTAAGTDNVLQENELEDFAKKLKVSFEDLKKAVSNLSGAMLANNIDKAIPAWYDSDIKKPDVLEDIINNKIDQDNIVSVLNHYNAKDKNSISEEIINNFEQEKAVKLMDKLVGDLSIAVKKEDLSINVLLEKYNNAKANNNLQEMSDAFEDMEEYLHYRAISKNLINEHMKITHTIDTTRGDITMNIKGPLSTVNDVILKFLAWKNDAPITNDLKGDGIVGNSISKATTEEGLIILEALQELLQDAAFNEKLHACFSKDLDKHCFSLYWPKDKAYFCSTENGLVKQDEVNKGTIGDGDMSIVVTATINRLKSERENITDKEQMKQYLLEKFM